MAAIVAGDRVIFRGTFGSNVFSTNLIETPPIMGWVYSVASPVCSVEWNNGEQVAGVIPMDTAAPNAIPVLKVSANPTSTALAGQMVRRTVNNQSSAFVGMVFALIGIQLVPDAATEVYTDHAVVCTPDGLFWLSPVSELEVVPGR
jgi:hypothetical protein